MPKSKIYNKIDGVRTCSEVLVYWYIACNPTSQPVLEVLKSLHISYICWYPIIVLSTTITETISTKQTFLAKLLTKPDCPTCSLPCRVGVGGAHLLVQVQGGLGLDNLMNCYYSMVKYQLLDTQPLALLK